MDHSTSKRRHWMRALAMPLAAIALLAMGSQSVSATTVTDEATGNPCPAVSPSNGTDFPDDSSVTGGCQTHFVDAEGDLTLTAHIFGIESTDSVCWITFVTRIGPGGEGYATNISVGGPGCNRRPCRNMFGIQKAWRTHLVVIAGTEFIKYRYCLENISGGGEMTCNLNLPFADVGSHQLEIGTVNGSDVPQEVGCEGYTGFRGELSVHLLSEDGAIEVN